MNRVKLAKAAQPGDCIAMEIADDEEFKSFGGCWRKRCVPLFSTQAGRRRRTVRRLWWWLLHFAALLREVSAEFSWHLQTHREITDRERWGFIQQRSRCFERLCPSLCTRQCLFFGITFTFDCDNGWGGKDEARWFANTQKVHEFILV